MNLIIIGAGRMGIRHAQGAVQTAGIIKITMLDISSEALERAAATLNQGASPEKISYRLLDDFAADDTVYDIAIIASTADSRTRLLKLLAEKNCRRILVEKPIGQSREEVREFANAVEELDISCSVNLNMRLYPGFQQLHEDLRRLPQLKGPVSVTINTGTIGIGANGIHYLDLLFFLLDADKAEIAAAEIDEMTIPSGRGAQFLDFGGWCVVKFYQGDQYKGKALISIGSSSTAMGGWEFITSHGRISINEIDQKRFTALRKEDSQMPLHRYAADYLPVQESLFAGSPLSELTAQWLEGIIHHKQLLPSVQESMKVHDLLFDWFSFSNTHREKYPIT
jgi:predicted dehydrogenase